MSIAPLVAPSTVDRPIWDLWMSQHHFPCVTVALDVGVFESLNESPKSAAELATALKLSERGLEPVLAVIASLDLLQHVDGKFTLTATSAQFLVKGSQFFWGGMLLHGKDNHLHARLKQCVETGEPSNIGAAKEWETGELGPERARRLTAAMHAHSLPSAIGFARRFSAVVPVEGNVKLLDVAGGSGCFSISLVRQHPENVKATILELPEVAKLAEQYAADAQVSDLIDTISIDMFKEAWPQGYDVHFFSNIFHDWAKDVCIQLAKSSFAALPVGGRIMLHEILLASNKDGKNGSTPPSFSVHMLIYTKGKQYTFEEASEILQAAGFQDVTAVPSEGYYSLVTGVKK